MTARIVIGTPMLDWSVGGNHHACMWELLRHDKGDWTILDPKILTGCDLVRARSRIVRIFLEETDGTHLLFLDADVATNARCVSGMVAAEVDAIGCAYPKKHIDAYGRVSEMALMREENPRVETDMHTVKAIGAGCLLLTRELLQEMTDVCEASLDDSHLAPSMMSRPIAIDEGRPTAMLFQLTMHAGALLPEDYSFCAFLRRFTRLWRYIGPGSQLQHEGHHIFMADDHGE